MSENLNIYERANYGHATQDEILEALAELVAWREMRDSVCRDVDTPEDFGRYVSDLGEQAGGCNNEDHARIDDYREFFRRLRARLAEGMAVRRTVGFKFAGSYLQNHP